MYADSCRPRWESSEMGLGKELGHNVVIIPSKPLNKNPAEWDQRSIWSWLPVSNSVQ